MKIIGVSFQKGKIRFTHIESKPKLKYVCHGNIKYDPELELPELVDRWKLDFAELFQREKPEIVASIEVWESESRNSSRFQIMPLAILASTCKEKDIPLKTYTPQAFSRGGPFGLPAKQKPIEAVDTTFGEHSPYWDDIQRRSVLAAWRAALG